MPKNARTRPSGLILPSTFPCWVITVDFGRLPAWPAKTGTWMPPKACSSLEAPPFGLPLKNVRMFAVYMTLSSICPSRSHLTKEGGQVAMVAHCHRQLARRKLHAQQEGGYAPSQTPRSHCIH